MNKKNKLLNAALQYAIHDAYSIIPIRKNKLPLIGAWKQFQEKPAEADQISEWWDKNPAANIGILTGKISGITVVDIDMSGGKSVSLDIFPKTFTVKTPTGGYHLYYRYTSHVHTNANMFKDLPHVDIRNDGGYVVAAPSEADYQKEGKRVHGFYTIERDDPIVNFPLEMFHVKETEAPAPAASGKSSPAQILKQFKGMEEGDGRNNALAKVIGKFLRVVPRDEWESTGWQMTLAANSQFKKPLPEKEVKTTFDSIRKKESSKPLSEVVFIKNADGDIIVNDENVYRTIKADPQLRDCFRTNSFAGTPEARFDSNKWEPVQRVDIVKVQMYLMRSYSHFVRVKINMVESALVRYMHEIQVSPPADWIASLVWDREPRLDNWLREVYGVADDEYHRKVASNWMKGLVKRIVQPGCKFDYVLVLEGKQGIKKSMSLAVLGGDWHIETVFTPDNKDFFMLFAGNAIVEFSEGETLSRTEAKRLKAVITMQHDKYRPPYERATKDFPRQCVFAMTTNQEQYLKDETGNRRWLPVACLKVANVEWLKANRDQLFAEAYYRAITREETAYEFPEAEIRAQQAMRQQTDPREELIFNWYFHKLTDEQRDLGITTRQAYVQGILGMDEISAVFGKEMSRADEMIISSVLRDTMQMDKRRTMESGSRYYKYFPTEATMKMRPPTIESIAATPPKQNEF